MSFVIVHFLKYLFKQKQYYRMATDTISHVDCIMCNCAVRTADVKWFGFTRNVITSVTTVVRWSVYITNLVLYFAQGQLHRILLFVFHIYSVSYQKCHKCHKCFTSRGNHHTISQMPSWVILCHEFRHLLQSLELKWSGGKVLYPLI